MANDYFKFKQFTVQQGRCAMKVNTDGVLLGAWVNSSDPQNILDVGTGTGLIALMLAQKFTGHIDAVEIEPDAYQQAVENVSASSWHHRIQVLNQSFQDYSLAASRQQFDLIVSNPPFFENSLKTPVAERNLARHNDLLSTSDLLTGVDKLLLPEGRFCVILPYIESQLLVVDAALHNLYCVRKTNIRPVSDKKVNRVLMEFRRERSKLLENELIIRLGESSYSEEYKRLTSDFYLFF
jgi:tRNA1Val (adenine37-N6)-methyltransferase